MTSPILAAATKQLAAKYDSDRALVNFFGGPNGYWAFPTLSLAQGWQQLDPERFAYEWPRIAPAVAASQVRSDGDPFDGNFTWLVDDDAPEDPNAVVFVMRPFLPIVLRDPDALASVPELEETITRAVSAIEYINLDASYTNIAIASTSCAILGGQIVGMDTRWAFDRLEAIVADVLSGAPTEYNSPSYVWHAVAPLLLLRHHADDIRVARMADALAERLAVHGAERLHPGTRAHLGPHSRCYVPELWSHHGVSAEFVQFATGVDWLPTISADSFAAVEMSILAPLATWPSLRRAVDDSEGVTWETTQTDPPSDAYTFRADTWGMGTASRQFHAGVGNLFVEGEMNNWLAHYRVGDDTHLVTSRFIENERHIGELGPAPDRPSDASYYEQGRFAGFQHENRSLLVYGFEPSDLRRTSSKALLSFTRPPSELIFRGDFGSSTGEQLDEIPFDSWFVVEDGDHRFRIQAKRSRSMASTTPAALKVIERGGRTEIEAFLYAGKERTLWEICEIGGVFWHDNPHVVFAVERMTLEAAADADPLFEHEFDELAAAVRWIDGDVDMGLAFDVHTLEPIGRTLNGAVVQAPIASGTVLNQLAAGDHRTGEGTVASSGPLWVYVTDEGVELVNPMGSNAVRVEGSGEVHEFDLGPGERALLA